MNTRDRIKVKNKLDRNHINVKRNLRIRKVVFEDRQAFIDVYRECYRGLEEYAYTKNREIKSYFRWLFSRDSDGFLVAELPPYSKPVGFIMVDTNWFSPFELEKVGEIHEIFVLPEYRNKGVGKILMQEGLFYAFSRNRRIAELWVGSKNYSARKFYKKLGFEERRGFGKWIRMRKDIK